MKSFLQFGNENVYFYNFGSLVIDPDTIQGFMLLKYFKSYRSNFLHTPLHLNLEFNLSLEYAPRQKVSLMLKYKMYLSITIYLD